MGHLGRGGKLEQQLFKCAIVQMCQQLPSLSPEQPGPSLTPMARDPDSTAMGILVTNFGALRISETGVHKE